MGRRGNQKRKDRRKKRNQEALEASLSKKGDGTRIRHTFSAKGRKGDAAEVNFTFSGIPVPFDEGDPSLGLREKTTVQRHTNDSTPDTQH